MLEKVGEAARAWADCSAHALRALRLNQYFPPWRSVAGHLQLLADTGPIRIVPETGMLAPREWVKARIDRDMATSVLAEFADLAVDALPVEAGERLQAKRRRMQGLLALDPIEGRKVHVALRNRRGSVASYKIVVDRTDVATGSLARYTIIASDTPGARISEGELSLRASEAFTEKLSILSTQDAALAFALLRERGLEVYEIVRGALGPAGSPSEAGPEMLRTLSGVSWSACMERVSLDLSKGRIDDPLMKTITVPGANVDFGLVVQRKWAVARVDKEAFRSWLKEHGSRNLVYVY